MKNITIILLSIIMALTIQGCSISKAASGPKAKDLSVLEKGTSRDTVILELGAPILSETNEAGDKTDLFKFVQGQHGAARAGKGLLYGVMAVGSLGLSELVTNPVEGAASGAEMQIKVSYDQANKVKEVVFLKDGRWLPIQRKPSK